VLFRPGAPKPWLLLLPVDNVISRGFNVSLAVHHFVRNLLWQNAEVAENGHMFQLKTVFQSHTPELHMQHIKPLQSRLKSAVCMRAVSAF
jgi:hypothetical protein